MCVCVWLYLSIQRIEKVAIWPFFFIIFVEISAFVKPYIKVDKDASTRMPYISESKKQTMKNFRLKNATSYWLQFFGALNVVVILSAQK